MRVSVLALVTLVGACALVGAAAQRGSPHEDRMMGGSWRRNGGWEEDQWGRDVERCESNKRQLADDAQYQAFLTANAGCTEGDCDMGPDGVRAIYDACARVRGTVCIVDYRVLGVNATATGADGYDVTDQHGGDASEDEDEDESTWGSSEDDDDFNGRRYRHFVCRPQYCPEPDTYEIEKDLWDTGLYQGVEVNGWCDYGADGSPVGVFIFELLCLAVVFGFAYAEKQRRASRMAALWPSPPRGNGSFRVHLFDCFGCSRLCWSSFCCGGVMAQFNRAELDRRQLQCCDICMSLSHGACCLTIYQNRQTVRERLDVKGECCIDCLTVVCCSSCAVAQHTAEIERGLPAAGTSGSSSLSGDGSGATGGTSTSAAIAPSAPRTSIQMSPVPGSTIAVGQVVGHSAGTYPVAVPVSSASGTYAPAGFTPNPASAPVPMAHSVVPVATAAPATYSPATGPSYM